MIFFKGFNTYMACLSFEDKNFSREFSFSFPLGSPSSFVRSSLQRNSAGPAFQGGLTLE